MTPTQKRQEQVKTYLRDKGWEEDRWGNFHHPENYNRRYKLGKRNLKLQHKHSADLGGGWFGVKSIPYSRLKMFSKGEKCEC